MPLEGFKQPLKNTDQRMIPVYNTSGEPIPPHSFVTPIGVAYNGGLKVAQVTETGDKLAMVTGDTEIASESWGLATCDWPARVAYDAGDGTPAANAIENWGPKAGNWPAKKNVTGWKLVGPAVADMPQADLQINTSLIWIEVCRTS